MVWARHVGRCLSLVSDWRKSPGRRLLLQHREWRKLNRSLSEQLLYPATTSLAESEAQCHLPAVSLRL